MIIWLKTANLSIHTHTCMHDILAKHRLQSSLQCSQFTSNLRGGVGKIVDPANTQTPFASSPCHVALTKWRPWEWQGHDSIGPWNLGSVPALAPAPAPPLFPHCHGTLLGDHPAALWSIQLVRELLQVQDFRAVTAQGCGRAAICSLYVPARGTGPYPKLSPPQDPWPHTPISLSGAAPSQLPGCVPCPYRSCPLQWMQGRQARDGSSGRRQKELLPQELLRNGVCCGPDPDHEPDFTHPGVRQPEYNEVQFQLPRHPSITISDLSDPSYWQCSTLGISITESDLTFSCKQNIQYLEKVELLIFHPRPTLTLIHFQTLAQH